MDSGTNGAQGKGHEVNGAAPPRSWLTPYLLMMLRSWNAYGYELVRRLAVFGFGSIDPGTVYRALRELEREGFVTSSWDTSVTSGPARRVYTITDVGIGYLGQQAAILEGYRRMLDHFFRLYGGGYAAAPSPSPAPEGQGQAPAREGEQQSRS